jgi:hypothetical protein
MRDLIHNAVADAREMVGGLVQDLRGENRLSDDEVLARYSVHRDDPVAKLHFVQQQTGLQGQALLDEGLKYEQEMEKLWGQRMGGGGA